MTETKQLLVDGQAISEKPLHYRACGLDDVYLLNGFEWEDTEHGRAVTIHDLEGLHNAIGMCIIMQQRPIRAREFRFLRKAMELTQEQLAQQLDVDAQTVARYEKDQGTPPKPTDLMIRVAFLLHKMPDDVRSDLLAKLYPVATSPAGNVPERFNFRQTKGVWDGERLAA